MHSLKPGALRLEQLPLDQIEPDPDQPRKTLGDLEPLAESIRQHGILQPIVVSAVEGSDRYRIIAGERRYRAAGMAGLESVPAIVRTMEDQQRMEAQLVENLQRRDLSPIEEATAYQRLMTEFGLSQRELAERTGRSATAINAALRVLTLPDEILQKIPTSVELSALSQSILVEIARLPTREQQLAVWQKVTLEGMTVRQARRAKAGKSSPKSATPDGPSTSPAVNAPPWHPLSQATPAARPPAIVRVEVCRAVVTVAFDRPDVVAFDIRQALEQALGTMAEN